MHRDVKASNVYLKSGVLKLGDFGIAKVLEHTEDAANTIVGTPYYMSPEVCKNMPYTRKSDVWALGCLLYELCMMRHAFTADNLLGLVYKIIRDKPDPIPNHYSDEMGEMIRLMLSKDVEVRPDIQELLNMRFVR